MAASRVEEASVSGAGSEPVPLTVVLVEDDWIEVEAVRRGVRRLGVGWSVRRFRDGHDALAGLRGEDPGGGIPDPYVVLLDLNMPRMTGAEFLRKVRADPRIAAARVFVLTTSDDPRDLAAMEALGVDGYFTKSDAGHDYVGALEALARSAT